jgi:hypothetical protein
VALQLDFVTALWCFPVSIIPLVLHKHFFFIYRRRCILSVIDGVFNARARARTDARARARTDARTHTNWNVRNQNGGRITMNVTLLDWYLSLRSGRRLKCSLHNLNARSVLTQVSMLKNCGHYIIRHVAVSLVSVLFDFQCCILFICSFGRTESVDRCINTTDFKPNDIGNEHHRFRQLLYVTIFIYFFQNFFHRHTKNINTKSTTFRKKLLPSSRTSGRKKLLPKRLVVSAFIFGVTMEKVLEEVYEDTKRIN